MAQNSTANGSSNSASNQTPLMRQYWDIKAAHEDKVLLFRMGDFFEMFFDDAVKAAPIIGIALTQRNKKSADETPMCGVPHHSIAGPINKLLKAGLRIAICDQIEDPKMAKGIVKRAVTRVLTPGMVYDTETLSQSESNYIASVDQSGIAFVDTSTGESFFFEAITTEEKQRLLSLLPVAELILEKAEIDPVKKTWDFSGLVTPFSDLSLDSSPVGSLPACAARLLSYVKSLGGPSALGTLKPFEKRSLQKRLELSPTTVRHLELFATYKGEGVGSLFTAMDRTQTSAGARTLRSWLAFPLLDLKEIEQRQQRVEDWGRNLPKLKSVREVLSKMGDIERRLSKLNQPQCNGRDLNALMSSIEAGVAVVEICEYFEKSENLKLDESLKQQLKDLALEISRTIVDEPPLLTKQGHVIRKGFSPELDELIELSTDSQSLLMRMEEEEKEKTGISSLKIRYNSVFGYYIEITNSHKEKVPARYLRKQTLTNAERYCTDELVELEKKVLSAQAKRGDLEFQVFDQLRQKCQSQAQGLLKLAQITSELDVITSFSWLSLEKKYVRPMFNLEGSLKLKASRHPVIEQTVKVQFVPNDIQIQKEGCLLLTGPNMAGKSTLMRQVALIVIMAQIGCPVPADAAAIPVFDHIFTRIGASDQLSEGLSTFMVEMTETAEMLKRSTRNSLLILDEIGRGTSTFDGMSLAQAILENVLTDKKAMTLFATHYHELTVLERQYGQLKNAHMTVNERNGEIRFLHTLVAGPAQKSYGIQVAKLAGLPSSVTSRAQSLLKAIEASGNQKNAVTNQLSLLDLQMEEESSGIQSEGDSAESSINVSALLEKMDQLEEIVKELRKYPVSEKTPIEAMNSIAAWQLKLKDTSREEMHS